MADRDLGPLPMGRDNFNLAIFPGQQESEVVEREIRTVAARKARSPKGRVSELLTLAEACNRFDLPFKRVWQLAELGLIHPARMPGKNRIYYVADELRAVLEREGDEPPPPADLDEARRRRRVKNGESVKGPQVSIPQLEFELVA